MQVIAVDKFIEAVRKRPALWDWQSDDYKNRELKRHGWREVCQIMCPKYAEMGEQERTQIGRDMQLKWKNLRDAYVRHIRVRLDKNQKSKHMRAYIYHVQMSFLRRVINPRVRSRRSPFAATSRDCVKEEEEESELTQEDLLEMVEHDEKSSGHGSSNVKMEEDEEEGAEEAAVPLDPLTPEVADNEMRDNDDMNFFKSLLPTLQNMRTEQKLKFRIDVMELLMTYHQSSN